MGGDLEKILLGFRQSLTAFPSTLGDTRTQPASINSSGKQN